jgi:hypothetical protein
VRMLVQIILYLMFSKLARGYNEAELPAKKRFRQNACDLFLSNEISATRATHLFADAQAAGAANVYDLAGIGSRSAAKSNLSRDLLRRLRKGKGWPTPYFFPCRIMDRKAEVVVLASMPIWLPHELVRAIRKRSDLAALVSTGGLDIESRARLRAVTASLRCDEDKMGCIGMWCDGCPCNWDRSQSMEVISMSFPGLTDEAAKIRIPLICIEKSFVATHDTWDDVTRVLAWSLGLLATGTYPAARDDGSPWTSLDKIRSNSDNVERDDFKAILLEFRGDWAMFKQVFRFPQHNEVLGCCTRCTVKPSEIRNVGLDAPWRQQRLTFWGLIGRMREQGVTISPLLNSPGMSIETFKLDWLHVVDQGIALDTLGNLFDFLVHARKFPGGNEVIRCKALFQKLVAYYAAHPDMESVSKLNVLKVSMFKRKKGKAPRLSARAAETRCLIPFAVQLVQEYMDDDIEFERSMKHCLLELAECYKCLSHDILFSQDLLCKHCRRYCTLYVGLSDAAADPLWRVKPKLHAFQELCEMSGASRPATSWTYRDEDFGGSAAKLSRRRGGKHSAVSQCLSVLNRFAAKHPVPRI